MPGSSGVCDIIAGLLIGESETLFNNANAYVGVGDSTTAFNSSQTDLQGTNIRKGMSSASYPKTDPNTDGSNNMIRYSATFGTSEANFRWEEWGVFNASSGGTMLSRKVEYVGEKTNSAVWVLEVDVTISV